MNSSPSSSPKLINRKTLESSYDISSEEEEVKQKPASGLKGELTSSGEKDIKFLLNTVDLQIQKSRDFANRLAQKK